MNTKQNQVPETIALTWDRDHQAPPDWTAIKEAASRKSPAGRTLAIITRIQKLWDGTETVPYAVMVNVRDGQTLVIGGGNSPAAIEDRRAIAHFQKMGIHEEAGFDGIHAGGTRNNQFAWWLTPDVIWNDIHDDENSNPDDFDQQAIEDAIVNLTSNNDWAWSQVNEMRTDIVNQARTLTHERRQAKETTHVG